MSGHTYYWQDGRKIEAEINICAPSNNFDDLGGFQPPGRGVMTTDNEGFGPDSDFTVGSRYTGRFGGTSSATPTVAGVCGLILSRNSSLSAQDIRAIIEQTANKDLVIASDTPVKVAGDFDATGFSLWFGHGKVNAASAVARAGELAGGQERIDVVAEDTPRLIPDTGEAIDSQILVESVGDIADLRIHLHITHSYIGDLRIDLVAPDGTVITLQNHQGGSQQNLNHIYSLEEIAGLSTLLGKAIAGMWTLRVADTWFWDQGQLDSWRLVVKLVGGVPSPALAREKVYDMAEAGASQKS